MIVRPATPSDASAMVHLLNGIIAQGGTTAHQTPFNEQRMLDHYITGPTQICCHVAVLDDHVIGFQHLDGPDPEQDGADGWGYIASFVAIGAAGKGVGQLLFPATRAAAIAAGLHSINATIRADNTFGLRYYQGLGFVPFRRQVAVPLTDGTPVDRIETRFNLDPTATATPNFKQ